MSNPYVGEIRLFAGNFEPIEWMFCDGRTLPIASFETLYSLIGTTYGGDGVSTFRLPDLRGRVPMHQSSSHPMGQSLGAESVVLGANQLPSHTHLIGATNADAAVGTASGAVFATTSVNSYSSDSPSIDMQAAAVGSDGASRPHPNLAPSLALNYIISCFGIYPSRP